MKSEHRHDLKTNELGKVVHQVTPFLEKNSNYILIGLGLAVVVAAVAMFLLGSTSTSTAGWTAMLQAESSNSIEEFAAVADKYPNTPVGDSASLIQAESYLENGIRNSFSDRATSNTNIERAQKILEDLSGKSSASDALKKRVLFAQARCAETKGDVGGAIDLYSKLSKDYDDPVYDGLADQRLKDLQTADAKDFYAWFRKQDPKPEDRAQPQDGGFPPGHPGVITLPEIPDILRLPPKPKTDEQQPAETKTDTPPAATNAATPPAETKPAETKPEEAKPAEEATPPENKPAETPPAEQSAAPDAPSESKEAPADNSDPSQK